MNSETFFKSEVGNDLKHKQGIYCLEQPLFKKDGKRILQIGYARDNLYKRIRDYKPHMLLYLLLFIYYGRYLKR